MIWIYVRIFEPLATGPFNRVARVFGRNGLDHFRSMIKRMAFTLFLVFT